MLKIPGTFDITSIFGRTLMFAIPFAGLAIMFLFSAVRQGFIWLAIVIVIMYITLQVNIVSRVNIKAKIYNELSVQDSLTGLLNRRGYQEYIDQLPEDQKIGVVFSDVNSLKMVNDTLGHEAGDQLIKKAAALLKESFPEGKLFRISGDEFVCFEEDIKDPDFEEKVKNLDMIIRENDRITSYGCSTGEGRNIFDLVRAAETEMYQNKTRYYIETGKERRR